MMSNNADSTFTNQDDQSFSNKDTESSVGNSTDFEISFQLRPNWEKEFMSSSNSFNATQNKSLCSSDLISETSFAPDYKSTPKSIKKKTPFSPLNVTVASQESALDKDNTIQSCHLFTEIKDSFIPVASTVNSMLNKIKTVIKDPVNQKPEAPPGACGKKTQHSFTKYVELRDIFLAPKERNRQLEQTVRKNMSTDQEYQKRIIKKLKFGMYVYGCNFKKISKYMAMQNEFMTPKMLYQIYRSFIAK